MKIEVIKEHINYPLGIQEVEDERAQYLINMGVAEKVEYEPFKEKKEIEPAPKVEREPAKEKVESKPVKEKVTRKKK